MLNSHNKENVTEFRDCKKRTGTDDQECIWSGRGNFCVGERGVYVTSEQCFVTGRAGNTTVGRRHLTER